MTSKKLDRYQLSLGERARRFTLVPPDPVHQPETTTRWNRVQMSAVVVLGCIAFSALMALAALIGGAW